MLPENFLSNNWIEGIGIALISAAILGLIKLFRKYFRQDKKLQPKIENKLVQNQSNKQSQNIVINNHIKESDDKKPSHREIPPATVNFYKQSTRILFIDDLDLKKKIKNLKNAGWQRIAQIKTAPNIDIDEIQNADIIFVDYKGIGELETEEQGLSILSALKKRYQDSKYLILYSAHDVPIQTFSRGAHDYLSKNSKIYELEQKILEGIAKIQK